MLHIGDTITLYRNKVTVVELEAFKTFYKVLVQHKNGNLEMVKIKK